MKVSRLTKLLARYDGASGRPSGQRGLALVTVLWVLMLLALIAASFMRTTRTEINLTRNLIENAEAEALADAGVYLAILALMDTDATKRPRADGTPYQVNFGDAEIIISVQDEGGKIDLNHAPDELLHGLFVSVGVESREADALVDAIADFRDPDDLHRLNGAEDHDYEAADLPWGAKDAPFTAVAELQQVLGMTPVIYRQVRPAVTVYSRQRGIDPSIAPRAVLLVIPGLDEVEVDALLGARAGSGSAANWESVLELGPVPSVGELPDSNLAAQEKPWEAVADPRGIRSYVSRSRGRVHTVRAEAVTATGAVFVREAVVGLTGDAHQPFRFHAWRQGDRSTPEGQETN